jgi:tRNA G18 (ribose-2'-O)-methylase SpoU
MVPFEYQSQPDLESLKKSGFRIVGLEQDKKSIMLNDYKTPEKVALLLGEEVFGITDNLRQECDDLIEIPMKGQKESFNVSVAAGIALYALSI